MGKENKPNPSASAEKDVFVLNLETLLQTEFLHSIDQVLCLLVPITDLAKGYLRDTAMHNLVSVFNDAINCFPRTLFNSKCRHSL